MFKFRDGIFCILFFISYCSYATTVLLVTENSDNDPDGFGQPGELRYCINTMNTDLNNGQFDDYEIAFDTTRFITLNGILPVINNAPNPPPGSNPINITINAQQGLNPIPTVTIDGNNAYPGFFIAGGNVTIQKMIFQNLVAKGGNGGDGISGGGGGMGAGAAIYAPRTFLNSSQGPAVTLIDVIINTCIAIGGNGGNYISILSPNGSEGGGGGGGFAGDGGSIIIAGTTGGAGGGGFGGNGGNVATAGGGGGGGGGFGSHAFSSTTGNGGQDQDYNGVLGIGLPGIAYPFNSTLAGSGAGGYTGGNLGGGGGGGGPTSSSFGGGGAGSFGGSGLEPLGNTPPLRKRVLPSGGGSTGDSFGDGGGGGGGGIVTFDAGGGDDVDGQGGDGGYGGGGGGGAGVGSYSSGYTVFGGTGGVGGGGGGGGVNPNGQILANGGDSQGGGGGGGGGPSAGITASGGIDTGKLGGGSGGDGFNNIGSGSGGGGGGGGSAHGAAIFVDSELEFTIKAMPDTVTNFNTLNGTLTAGSAGSGGDGGGLDGQDGATKGESIFLREHSVLTFIADHINDVLELGEGVAFTDDTVYGGGDTKVNVLGNGTVIYQGTTNYSGLVHIQSANFKLNGQIQQDSGAGRLWVCRNSDITGSPRGTLSGNGSADSDVLVNSGILTPDVGETLTLGSLRLLSASSGSGLGSIVHIEINSNGTSLIAVNGTAELASSLEINLAQDTPPGSYVILTSTGFNGTRFDSVTVTGASAFKSLIPNYKISYLPEGAPTYVQFDFYGFQPSTSVDIPATVNGSPILNPAVVCCGRPVLLGPLPVSGSGPTIYTVSSKTGNVTCKIGQTKSQTFLKMYGKNGSCTIIGTKNGIVSNPLTVIAP